MKQSLFSVIRLFLTGLILLMVFSHGDADGGAYKIPEPNSNNGQKWRIGYMEGGPYENYQSVFRAFIDQLMENGWIKESALPVPSNPAETRTLWEWLASGSRSAYLEFPADAFWSGNWNQKRREENASRAIKRFNKKGDIDLMLAFGTWAGLDLANNDHKTATMLFSTSNPVRAGIVKNEKDTGYDHFHVRIDSDRYKRQIRLFHNIIGFEKLGIAYQNTPDGRTYAALDDVRDVARELDFEVVECFYPRQPANSLKEKQTVLECHRKLAPRIDAFYLTEQTGVNLHNLRDLLVPFFKYQIPTFAQRRTYEVKRGVLMSLAQIDFKRRAGFHAQIFSRILNGEKPRNLPLFFEDTQEIAINLETARIIEIDLPLELMAGAKEIYDHIEE